VISIIELQTMITEMLAAPTNFKALRSAVEWLTFLHHWNHDLAPSFSFPLSLPASSTDAYISAIPNPVRATSATADTTQESHSVELFSPSTGRVH